MDIRFSVLQVIDQFHALRTEHSLPLPLLSAGSRRGVGEGEGEGGREKESITEPWSGLPIVSYFDQAAEAAKRVTVFAQHVTTFVSHLWVDHNKLTEEGLHTGSQVAVDVSDVENPRSLLPDEAVVINENQTDMGVSDTTTLVHQTPLGAQATRSFDIENPRGLIEVGANNGNVIVRDQTHVSVSDTTPLLHLTPVDAQATSSFDIENPRSLSQNEVTTNVNAAIRDQPGVDITASILPQMPIVAQATSSFHIQHPENLPREVVSNGNVEVRDETVVDMSYTAFLLPQTLIAAQAIRNTRNLPQGGEHNFPGVTNVGSGVPSQHSQPPTPNAGCGIDIQALLTEAKEVANRVLFISAGGIFSELSGVIGNEKAVLLHENFFKAFMILCYVSLALGLALHRLIKISPETRGFVTTVKLTIYFSQGSLVFAISFAICLIFPSKVGVVFILVGPLIPIGFVAILSFASRDHVSIS